MLNDVNIFKIYTTKNGKICLTEYKYYYYEKIKAKNIE